MEKDGLIDLEIALDYPVNWGFEQTIRDLIQNFYDGTGYLQFGKDFSYHVQAEENGFQLKMEYPGHSFPYDWLIYIGGSTKTDSEKTNIGKYGEGFKMCMLSLFKMNITRITMHSESWEITPCTIHKKVAGESVAMLGYQYRTVPDDGMTSLIISGIPKTEKCYLDEALLHFFYPENPLFGRLLYDTDKVTIYEGSGKKIPCRQNLNMKGIIYIHGLARGRLPFPLFIMVKRDILHLSDTRRRKNLEWYECWESMYIISRFVDASGSYQILEILKEYWNDIPVAAYDSQTWYYVICQLVRNVSSSEYYSQLFIENYPELAYIERKGRERVRNTLIQQTGIWAKEHNRKRLVNSSFRLLGAESLVDTFSRERDHGFRQPKSWEKEMIDLLFRISDLLIPEDLCQAVRPAVLIGNRKQAAMNPLCFATRETGKKKQGKRNQRRYHLDKLILDENTFLPDTFEKSLISFCDKLLQVSGTKNSNRMNLHFTNLGATLISCSDQFFCWKQEWQSLAQKQRIYEETRYA